MTITTYFLLKPMLQGYLNIKRQAHLDNKLRCEDVTRPKLGKIISDIFHEDEK